jgi:hypothetical protein
MHKNIAKLLRPIIILAVLFVVMLAAPPGFAAKKKASPPAYPPGKAYGREAVLKTLINPHEQINDEGEILWGKCLICHRNVPDIKKERSIKDVKLRFDKEIKDICYRCHTVIKHPGAEGATAALLGRPAPLHLIEPPPNIYMNMRLAQKDVSTIMPLDPNTGKITCPTCHNPHERGVLVGKADWGADSVRRLRTEGLDICQFCHRK